MVKQYRRDVVMTILEMLIGQNAGFYQSRLAVTEINTPYGWMISPGKRLKQGWNATTLMEFRVKTILKRRLV